MKQSLISVIVILIVATSTLYYTPSHATSMGTLTPGQEIYHRDFYSGISGLDWSSDGNYIAVALTSSRLAIYTSYGDLVGSYSLPHGTGQVAWRPGYEQVAVAAGTKVQVYTPSGSIVYQRDIGSRTLSVAWSEDGDRLTVGTDNGTLFMVDFKLGVSCKCRLPGASITSLAFTHSRDILLIGDSNGFIKVYSLKTLNVLSSMRLNDKPVRGISIHPLNNTVAIMTDTASFIGIFNGTHVNLIAQIPYGGIGSPVWSPRGKVVFFPAQNRGVIVSPSGSILDYINPLRGYPILYASWNPTLYSRLAIAGFNSIYGVGSLIVIYSGSLVEIISSTPVEETCWGTLCGGNITFSPDQENITLKLKINAYDQKGQPATALVDVNLSLRPFQKTIIDAGKIIVEEKLPLKTEGGKILLVLLHHPATKLYLTYRGETSQIPGQVIYGPPGEYHLTLEISKPDNYLGPEWILEKKLDLTLKSGEVALLNYTSFNIETVTASLHVSSEVGAKISIIFPNSTASTILRVKEADYTIPTGSYKITMELPGNNTLIPSSNILESSTIVTVYPGDMLTLSFHYSDVVGKLIVRAPPGTRVTITPPWSTPLKPANISLIMDKDKIEFLAYPGVYKIEFAPPTISNFLGPKPPKGFTNATVEKGLETIVDAYSVKEVSDYLRLLESSARITVVANKGYILLIRQENTTYKFNITGNMTFLIPPGSYEMDLVKPGKELLILKSKKLNIVGPANITVDLTIKQTPTTTTFNTYTPVKHGGRFNTRIIAGIGIIVAVVIVSLVLIMRMRGREELRL